MRRVDWKWWWKAVKNSGLHGFKSLGASKVMPLSNCAPRTKF